MKKSLYEVAGVPPAAPSAVIGMAIQRRLQKMQDSGDPDAAAQAYALREAWSVLGDEKRRAAYDAKLAAEAAKAPPVASAKPATAAVANPATPPVARPAPAPRVATPDEMELVFIVEEAHAPSRLKTYITVASVLLAFVIGGLWMMTGSSRGSKGATPGATPAKGAVDGRTPFAKARGAQAPQSSPPAPSPAAPSK